MRHAGAVIIILTFLFICAIALSGCASQTQPLVSKGNFCGRSTNGTCSTDTDCARGGCSGQVCQSKSEPSAITTCEYADCYDPLPYGVSCGCADSKCQWIDVEA